MPALALPGPAVLPLIATALAVLAALAALRVHLDAAARSWPKPAGGAPARAPDLAAVLAGLAFWRGLVALGLLWWVAQEPRWHGESGLAVVAAVLAIAGAAALGRLVAAARPTGAAALSRALVPVVAASGRLALPFCRLARRSAGRLFGAVADADRVQTDLRDDIAGAIALGHSGGAFAKEGRDRLLGALDLSDRTVEEIMRHRRQIEMIDAGKPPAEIIRQMLASPHSRLPVFRDDKDNIVGVIHTKELLREVDRLIRPDTRPASPGDTPDPQPGLSGLDIVKVAMKPYFIPETTTLDEQMRAFLARRTHFALVVDEYGSLQGLITLEDILEEIVGEITDEFDVISRSAGLGRAENGDLIVDGAMTIRDLNRALDWHLPDDEANTVAGLVIHEARIIPVAGQVFHFHGFRFEVAERVENRITRLHLRPA